MCIMHIYKSNKYLSVICRISQKQRNDRKIKPSSFFFFKYRCPNQRNYKCLSDSYFGEKKKRVVCQLQERFYNQVRCRFSRLFRFHVVSHKKIPGVVGIVASYLHFFSLAIMLEQTKCFYFHPTYGVFLFKYAGSYMSGHFI